MQLRGHVCLAVGDGGNDELMIRKANVGVGITGVEGTAASRAADYAIGSFRFLHTLLLVHGAWCYRRQAKLVCYIFYKSLMVALCMYLFGIYSGFSGTQFFNDPLYTLYNVFFTASPILVVAVFDQVLHRETLENHPRVYMSRMYGGLFNREKFFKWMLRGVLHAILIFYFAYYCFEYDLTGNSGQTAGLWFHSTVVFTCIVWLSTFRLLLETVNITWFHIIFVGASFLLYLPIIVGLNYFLSLNPDLYGVVNEMLSSPLFWLYALFTVGTPILIDAGLLAIKREYNPTYSDILQEAEMLGTIGVGEEDNEVHVKQRSNTKVTAKDKDAKKRLKSPKDNADDEDGEGADESRANAAILHMISRMQNLSGSAFDATHMKSIMQEYERGADGDGAATQYQTPKVANTPKDSREEEKEEKVSTVPLRQRIFGRRRSEIDLRREVEAAKQKRILAMKHAPSQPAHDDAPSQVSASAADSDDGNIVSTAGGDSVADDADSVNITPPSSGDDGADEGKADATQASRGRGARTTNRSGLLGAARGRRRGYGLLDRENSLSNNAKK